MRPAPTSAKAIVACGLSQGAPCPDRADCTLTPATDATFTRLCIHRDGDGVPCPSADYGAQFVAYRGERDTRACSVCTGKVTGSCGTQFSRDNSPECNGGSSNVNVDTCADARDAVGFKLPLGPRDAGCEPGKSDPAGSIAESDPVTFCCNK